MPRYNRNFELTLNDIDLIEAALRSRQQQIHGGGGEDVPEVTAELSDIQDLLGRLHNQKVFYRPKDGVYVGG